MKMDLVVLKVSDRKFTCSRVTLAQSSPYFQAMFTHDFAERDQGEIEIKGLDPDAMEMLLSSLRSGKDVLRGRKCEEVLSLLQASSMLHFEALQEDCVNVILQQWLTNCNCLSIMAHADALNLTSLYHKSRVRSLWEFSKIKNTSSFLRLTISELEDYLQDEGLNAINGEVEVFEACCSWIQDPEAVENRQQLILQAIKCVRFADISPSDIRTILLCSNFNENKDVLKILECVLKIKEGKAQNCAAQERFANIHKHPSTTLTEAEPRCCPSTNNNAGLSKEPSVNEFVSEIDPLLYIEAEGLLDKLPRLLPLVPCIVGHCYDPPQPHVIAFKDNKLVPVLRLTKAEQAGSVEAIGYRVIIKGPELFTIGGEFLWGHNNWNKSIWKYDKLSEEWSFETSLEHHCRHQSVCCLDDDIYVMGGFGKYRVISDSVNKYSTITKSWTHCAPLPSAIYSAASCAFKGCIYVFGPQIWSYNPDRNNWLTLASNSNIGYNCAMAYGDTIYLTGMYSQELMQFDSNRPDIAPKSIGRFKSNATNTCLVHNSIYLFGIDSDTQQLLVEMYSIRDNSFQVLWTGDSKEEESLIEFSSSSSVGCFPMINFNIIQR